MATAKIPALVAANELYFQTLHECNLEKFDRVFHPSCSLFDTTGGKLSVIPVADYRAAIAERVSPHSKGLPREDVLISLDFLSETMAVTKVQLRTHEKVFIDHLNWAEVDGHFMIVAKHWHRLS